MEGVVVGLLEQEFIFVLAVRDIVDHAQETGLAGILNRFHGGEHIAIFASFRAQSGLKIARPVIGLDQRPGSLTIFLINENLEFKGSAADNLLPAVAYKLQETLVHLEDLVIPDSAD